MNAPHRHSPLAVTLRKARKGARLSQLELALRIGVSQRHISFVESGRARPSRDLLVAWLEELQSPLVLRNAAMTQAGYAPLYSDSSLDDPQLSQARAALERLLAAHDPMPAIILDVDWNVLALNRGARWLFGLLMPGLVISPHGPSVNLLDALAHPDGLLGAVINLEQIAQEFLARLRHETTSRPSLASKVEQVAAYVGARFGSQKPNRILYETTDTRAPVLTTRLRTPVGVLAIFSMFTTFGTPLDVSLSSLRVEHFFPADEDTAQLIRQHVDEIS